MGYSDILTLTTFYNHLGLVTFNGPVASKIYVEKLWNSGNLYQTIDK